ncbi:MAG: hypothetical protein V4587_00200 [Acidobacteriota bacterium]
MKSSKDHPGQILMFGDVLADGLGGFRIVPKKPTREICAREAEKVLGLGNGSFSYIVNTALGQKHLKWRRLSDRPRSKFLVEYESVIAYLEATKKLD